MKEMKKVILITGAAGFIGSNLAKNILQKDSEVQVIGIDNLNDYYDVSLKEYRLKELENWDNFSFGGTGRRALFDHEPGCLYREQYPWIL